MTDKINFFTCIVLPQDDGCTFAANKTNNIKKRRNYLNSQKNQKTFGGIKINAYLWGRKKKLLCNLSL